MWKIKNNKKHPYCDICDKIAFDQYMVTNDVWLSSGLSIKSHACLCCFETKLGRSLLVSDFVNAPINDIIFKGIEIGIKLNRLGNEPDKDK